MRPAFSLILVSAAVWADTPFQNLAPNGDGSVLYFSSNLRLKGTDQFPHEKIFVWEGGRGVRLYEERPATIIQTSEPSYYTSSTAYHLLSASISSDANTVVLTGLADCTFGTPCARSVRRYGVEVRRTGQANAVFDGSASLSPSGRYLLLGSPMTSPSSPPRLELVDLQTGVKSWVQSWSRPPYRHGVADDASTLVRPDSRTLLRSGKTGEERQIFPSQPVGSALINAQGSRVFFLRYPETGATPPLLSIVDIESASVRDVASVAAREPAPPAAVEAPKVDSTFDISDAGDLVAWTDGGQLRVARFPVLAPESIATPSPADTVVVSGDGTKLFVVTSDYAILRLDLRTGTFEEIVPPTPSAPVALSNGMKAPPHGVLVRGSSYSFEAEDLPPITGVRFNGEHWAVLSADRQHISFQVPWDAAVGIGRLEFNLGYESRSPFESAIFLSPRNIVNQSPQFYRLSSSRLTALHQDFSGLVTDDRPARSGEVIHLFGSGFGPVTPAEGGLSRVEEPLSCAISQLYSERPVELLFAGLAPGLVGVYQIDVRLPADLQPGDARLFCRCTTMSCGTAGALPVIP